MLLAAWAAAQPAAAVLTFERTIQAPSPLPNERFGSVVVRFGTSNTVLVGADDHLFLPSNVYRVNALTAAQVASFHSPSNWDSDRFGAAIAADGSSVFVGNPGWNNDKGAVYQFDAATGGAPLWQLENNNLTTPVASEFGTALAVIGGQLLVGAPGAYFSGTTIPTGQVLVFDIVSRTHVATCEATLAATGARYGSALATIGTSAYVGAPFFSEGLVFRVSPTGGTCTSQGFLQQQTTGTPAAGRFGSALANVDGRLAVGAPGDGEVEVFDATNTFLHETIFPATTLGFGATLGTMGANPLTGTPGANGGGALIVNGVNGGFADLQTGTAGSEFGASLASVGHRLHV
jgi:hypothetical protein